MSSQSIVGTLLVIATLLSKGHAYYFGQVEIFSPPETFNYAWGAEWRDERNVGQCRQTIGQNGRISAVGVINGAKIPARERFSRNLPTDEGHNVRAMIFYKSPTCTRGLTNQVVYVRFNEDQTRVESGETEILRGIQIADFNLMGIANMDAFLSYQEVGQAMDDFLDLEQGYMYFLEYKSRGNTQSWEKVASMKLQYPTENALMAAELEDNDANPAINILRQKLKDIANQQDKSRGQLQESLAKLRADRQAAIDKKLGIKREEGMNIEAPVVASVQPTEQDMQRQLQSNERLGLGTALGPYNSFGGQDSQSIKLNPWTSGTGIQPGKRGSRGLQNPPFEIVREEKQPEISKKPPFKIIRDNPRELPAQVSRPRVQKPTRLPPQLDAIQNVRPRRLSRPPPEFNPYPNGIKRTRPSSRRPAAPSKPVQESPSSEMSSEEEEETPSMEEEPLKYEFWPTIRLKQQEPVQPKEKENPLNSYIEYLPMIQLQDPRAGGGGQTGSIFGPTSNVPLAPNTNFGRPTSFTGAFPGVLGFGAPSTNSQTGNLGALAPTFGQPSLTPINRANQQGPIFGDRGTEAPTQQTGRSQTQPSGGWSVFAGLNPPAQQIQPQNERQRSILDMLPRERSESPQIDFSNIFGGAPASTAPPQDWSAMIGGGDTICPRTRIGSPLLFGEDDDIEPETHDEIIDLLDFSNLLTQSEVSANNILKMCFDQGIPILGDLRALPTDETSDAYQSIFKTYKRLHDELRTKQAPRYRDWYRQFEAERRSEAQRLERILLAYQKSVDYLQPKLLEAQRLIRDAETVNPPLPEVELKKMEKEVLHQEQKELSDAIDAVQALMVSTNTRIDVGIENLKKEWRGLVEDLELRFQIWLRLAQDNIAREEARRNASIQQRQEE